MLRSSLRAIAAVIVGGTTLFGMSSPAFSNNVFQDLWGIVDDPIKLRASSRELSDSIQRTMIQLNELEATGNYDGQQRLEQIRSIAQEVIDHGDVVVADALSRMTALETKTNDDAVRLIAGIECASKKRE